MVKSQNEKTDFIDNLQWQVSIPIFGHPVILKQLGIALGIPFGIILTIIAVSSGWSTDTLNALSLVAAAFILTWLLLKIIYRGKYEVEFMLDDHGVLSRTQETQRNKNRMLNRLTILLGLLTNRPGAMGAGIMAQSRQEVYLQWKHIQKVTFKPRQLTIILRGGWTEQIALFCSQENYEQAQQWVLLKTQRLSEVTKK